MPSATYPTGSAGTGYRHLRLISFCLGLAALLANAALAASYDFVALESLFQNPGEVGRVHPRAIVVTSSKQRFQRLPRNMQNALKDRFVYQTRVRVDGRLYYRLAVGNFESERDAQQHLRELRPVFADAWIYQRVPAERQALESNFRDR